MGTSKEKTGRVVLAVVAAVTGKFDAALWKQFVISSGARTQPLAEYYLGKTQFDSRWQYGELAKAFQELLADAVAVGAVKLPPGYAATDFQIRVAPYWFRGFGKRRSKRWRDEMCVFIVNTQNQHKNGSTIIPPRSFKMGSTSRILSTMDRVVRTIL